MLIFYKNIKFEFRRFGIRRRRFFRWIFTTDENRPDQSNRATILIISLRTVVLDDADPFRKVDYWHGKHRAP